MKSYLFIYGPLGGGGAERVLLDILKNFDYTRYNVDLCLLCPGGVLYDEIPQEVNVITLYKYYTLSYRLAYHLSTRFGLDYFLKNRINHQLTRKYDVTISFLEGLPLKLHALIDKSNKNVSWVHCDLLRFPYEKNQFFYGEELRAYGKMDKIICVAKDTEIAFQKRFPQLSNKTEVIYNPIDYKEILYKAEEEVVCNDVFTIITVGRLTPPKKMERVLQVAKVLKAKGYTNIKFQIIGDGELKEQLQNQITNNNLTDTVELLGFKKNPYPIIKTADMMFCCSGFEGFCLVICEAMLLGVPVVSTRTSGPIEILGDDKYGMLCDHTLESMVYSVEKMISDKQLRLHYSEVGKERVKDFYVENTMRQVYSL